MSSAPVAYRQKAEELMNNKNIKMHSCMGTWGRGREVNYLHSHCGGTGKAPAGEDTAAPEILVKKPSLVQLHSRETQCLGKLSTQALPLASPGPHPVQFWSLYELRSSYGCYLWPSSGQQSSPHLHPPPLGGERPRSLAGLFLLCLS